MAVARRLWERPRGSQAEWARMTADPVANAIALSASSAAAGSGARAAARQETLRAARLVGHAMAAAPASEAANATGCEALAELASDSNCRAWLRVERDRESPLVSALLEAMARHPRAPRVQLAGVTALAVLAMDPHHREAVVLAGGVQRVATALRAHPTDLELQQFALGAMLQLLGPPDSEQSEETESQALALAEAALAAFPAQAEIQRLGTRLQRRVASAERPGAAAEPATERAAAAGRQPEPEPEPEPEPPSTSSSRRRLSTGSTRSPTGSLSPSSSAGTARAQAYIDSIRGQASAAAAEGGPSPEAQHRYVLYTWAVAAAPSQPATD